MDDTTTPPDSPQPLPRRTGGGRALRIAGVAVLALLVLAALLAAGVGVRWRSPVGPLKVDWSWGQEIHAGRIDLSIGIAF